MTDNNVCVYPDYRRSADILEIELVEERIAYILESADMVECFGLFEYYISNKAVANYYIGHLVGIEVVTLNITCEIESRIVFHQLIG